MLALAGDATHGYAVSFIVTNIPSHDEGTDKIETVRDVQALLAVQAFASGQLRGVQLQPPGGVLPDPTCPGLVVIPCRSAGPS